MKLFLCTTLFVAQCLALIPQAASAANLLSWQDIKGFENEDPDALLGLVETDCKKMESLPSSAFLGTSKVGPQLKHPTAWHQVCTAYHSLKEQDMSLETKGDIVRKWFMKWFDPYRLTEKLKLHYYYEPTFEASATPMGAYMFPIYRRPAELLVQPSFFSNFGRWVGGDRTGRKRSYYSREEIDKGVLSNRNLEIAWLRSPWEVFVLQTMGGGRLHLTDGSFWRVEYDGRNGHKHASAIDYLNKTHNLSLKNEEELEGWINQHKKLVYEILHANPDYAFFKQSIAPLELGEKGTFDINLIPARTVAVDSRYIPLGSLLWVASSIKKDEKPTKWEHLTLAADNNMSLKDIDSVSLYLGWGKEAAQIARKADLHPAPNGDMVLFAPRRTERTRK